MDKDFFEREAENNPFSPYLRKTEPPTSNPSAATAPSPPPPPKERTLPEAPNGNFLPFFFVELLNRFKNALGSIKTFTHVSRDKLSDAEFRESFYRIVNDDIEEIESVINSLLSYIKLNTPVIKSNTVHRVLEEVLKKYENQLDSKKIRIVKKFEKDLPETIVHEEQLRYIFTSVLEYAIPLTIPNGSIGFLTRVLEMQKESDEIKAALEKDGRYVEVMIAFTGHKKSPEQFESILGIEPARKEEGIDLKLLLVKEIVRKNLGTMKFDVNEKKPKTLITVIFPIERRKVIYYPSPPL